MIRVQSISKEFKLNKLPPNPELAAETELVDDADFDTEDLDVATARIESLQSDDHANNILGQLLSDDSDFSPTKKTRPVSHKPRPEIQNLRRVHDWSEQGPTNMVYDCHIEEPNSRKISVQLCHVRFMIPKKLGIKAGRVIIELQVSGEMQRHPKVFARDATVDDPARRIAVKTTCFGPNQTEIEFYPSRGGIKTVAKVNALADRILNGESVEDIAKNRRFLYWNARRKATCHQSISAFSVVDIPLMALYADGVPRTSCIEFQLHGSVH
jgi:hypothetical protein